MTSPIVEIRKILDSLLNIETLQKLSEKGEFPKVSFKKKSGEYGLIYVELFNLCGKRITEALGRALSKGEMLFVDENVTRFLTVAIKS